MEKIKTVGIIDADLLGRNKHRFPNLVCEKISAYWKEKGATVTLLMDYDSTDEYDRVYISKVFTDTPIPERFANPRKEPLNVKVGGTGFFFDKAPNLPRYIEHHMPDYHLYDEWIDSEVDKARKIAESSGKVFNQHRFLQQFKEYKEYSIGFLTRGCFRKCGFCVNKKYDHVFRASMLSEFMDPEMPKLCFLDDNFLGCPFWKEILEEVLATGKRFKFKQGLDERLLTDEKCKMIFTDRYDGDYTFAFDKIEDYKLIETKLKMIRRHTNSQYIKFYVLVGFTGTDEKDIENAFKRIALLLKYGCVPYIMRYQSKDDQPWKDSEWRGMYITMARWANQPSIVKKMTIREFAEAHQRMHKTKGTLCAPMKAITEFEKKHPTIAKKYFDIRYVKPSVRK